MTIVFNRGRFLPLLKVYGLRQIQFSRANIYSDYLALFRDNHCYFDFQNKGSNSVQLLNL
jgi:hypothetical protein